MRVSPNNASWEWSLSALLCVTTWLQVIPDIIPKVADVEIFFREKKNTIFVPKTQSRPVLRSRRLLPPLLASPTAGCSLLPLARVKSRSNPLRRGPPRYLSLTRASDGFL